MINNSGRNQQRTTDFVEEVMNHIGAVSSWNYFLFCFVSSRVYLTANNNIDFAKLSIFLEWTIFLNIPEKTKK